MYIYKKCKKRSDKNRKITILFGIKARKYEFN